MKSWWHHNIVARQHRDGQEGDDLELLRATYALSGRLLPGAKRHWELLGLPKKSKQLIPSLTWGHEPCAQSIPRGVLSSLDFLENIGNVEDPHRLPSRPLVCRVAKDREGDLKMATLDRIRKKAPMLLAIVMCYEINVIDLTNHV